MLVHSPEYANWVFGKSHPTQGRRFLHGRNQIILEAQRRHLNIDEVLPEMPHTDDLLLVHDPIYIHNVTVRGESDEWDGQRHDLGDLAKLFVGGTLTALDLLLEGKTKLAIHLAGAKHHAMYDYSSGFCVFNDLAIASTRATLAGHKVAIFDCDAHHGDGTEELLRSNPNVLTFSVHQYGIFPGTGLLSDCPAKSCWAIQRRSEILFLEGGDGWSHEDTGRRSKQRLQSQSQASVRQGGGGCHSRPCKLVSFV
jgi:acetoin utilization protein AcuC